MPAHKLPQCMGKKKKKAGVCVAEGSGWSKVSNKFSLSVISMPLVRERCLRAEICPSALHVTASSV